MLSRCSVGRVGVDEGQYDALQESVQNLNAAHDLHKPGVIETHSNGWGFAENLGGSVRKLLYNPFLSLIILLIAVASSYRPRARLIMQIR